MLETDKFDMVAPGSRVAAAHSKDVLNHLADGGVSITPDVVEKKKSSDVQSPFCWKFSKQKVE